MSEQAQTEQPQSLRFAHVASLLNRFADDHGLRTVTFRSPPMPGVNRTVRRVDMGDGQDAVIVSVRLANPDEQRHWPQVVADMIAGVAHANQLHGEAEYRFHADAWDLLSRAGVAW